jgi:hypothetical protein
MKKKVEMSAKRLSAILTQFAIDRELWAAWKALVFYGKRPSKVLSDELTYRFYNHPNYRKCLKAILTEVSEAYYKAMGIRFPPPEYQAPHGYAFYKAS